MFYVKDYYHINEIIELAECLISIPSHSHTPGQEKQIAEFIYDFCGSHGLEVTYQQVKGKRKNVLAILRGSGRENSLMLNGHMDTVPPGHMTIDPYREGVHDGFVWGRGAADMKGGLAVMIMALVAMRRAGVVPDGDLVFAGVVGEEGKSEGTEHLINSGIRTSAAIVGEPSNYQYAVGHRGLEWFDVIFKTKAAHSGSPEENTNAIEKAAEFIYRAKRELYPKIRERQDEFAGVSLMNIGVIEGGQGQSTVADSCTVKIDRRYIPGETVESVTQEYQEILDEMQEQDPSLWAVIRKSPANDMKMNHPPLITPMIEPIVHAVKTSIREVIKQEPKITLGRGWTDAALLKVYGKIPTVVFGPGNITHSHTADERIAIKDLVNTTEIFVRIIDNYCIRDKITETGSYDPWIY
ncbi:MAG: M20 family metallopeptidase [Bacillota bacterium]|nr:M20 family metallopeptidase [Bacillota bacterium]MDW7676912.1 M20 family metallopeptidase [Bacillota bacterium]